MTSSANMADSKNQQTDSWQGCVTAQRQTAGAEVVGRRESFITESYELFITWCCESNHYAKL